MASKITLNGIVARIVKETPSKPPEIRKFLSIILNGFRDALKQKERIELRGLGTFFVKQHKAKYIRLKTKIIDSKIHFVILFKESLDLSRKVNQP
jgi:nucleoid DNA-binding protein